MAAATDLHVSSNGSGAPEISQGLNLVGKLQCFISHKDFLLECLKKNITPRAGWSIQQRPCSLASITTAAGQSTHCPGTLAFITAAAGWSTQRCPRTLALIIDIAAVS
ncbi:hypothetical protein ACOMHN_036527 [Nucella lapillus]